MFRLFITFTYWLTFQLKNSHMSNRSIKINSLRNHGEYFEYNFKILNSQLNPFSDSFLPNLMFGFCDEAFRHGRSWCIVYHNILEWAVEDQNNYCSQRFYLLKYILVTEVGLRSFYYFFLWICFHMNKDDYFT